MFFFLIFFKKIQLKKHHLFIQKTVCRALYRACSTTKTSINLTSLSLSPSSITKKRKKK